ncbi:cleft lip and palate transmembrane protein 1-domain-containing protein [Flagelloscypha sp. PMI_526]|nr:cleft lip and palate transmembrane protein 1-domain-containing protein [Flagelloscypha sp. PMI_526]
MSPKPPPTNPDPVSTDPLTAADAAKRPPQAITLDPRWSTGQTFDIHIYISDSQDGNIFYNPQHTKNLPNFLWSNVTFGDWSESRTVNFDIQFPESVTAQNQSLWAEIFIVKDGGNPDYTKRDTYDPSKVHHIRKTLTTYLAKTKIRKERNLLTAGNLTEEEQVEEPDVIVPHWYENVTLALVSEDYSLAYNAIPMPMAQRTSYYLSQTSNSHLYIDMVITEQRDVTGTKGYYYPIVYPNEFWRLREHYVEINSTTTTLPVQITFQPLSFWKFQMFSHMSHGFNEAAKQQGGAGGAELDEVKRMFIETKPWFLMLTAAVSVLHMVFEMLAFKNDVSHWRHKKEMVGVSVRTIVANVFVQIVILLYLIDNNENTSWMILFGSGMSALIEAWKITKAVDISLVPSAPGSKLPYRLNIKDKHVLSEDERKTQEYDKLAFKYVSWGTVPLLLAYSVYSLIYDTHRGWYSFVITTLTSFVYMFGFVQLVPQLIINYKLKSVAHMPMKAMIYKTLSTVVDDFFAFCIKMPTLHRLACFRDDVVFCIFLYQRWIYRVDPKRVNEYGQVRH